MTPEERQMLAGLFERINATSSAPRDAEAESFINDAVRQAPFAPYVLAQTALVQQHTLEAAAHRIAELEAHLHEAAQQQQGQGEGSFLGNLGRSLFGGGAPSTPPRPGYDPSPDQPGPTSQQGYAPPPPPPPPPQYATPRPGPWGASAPSGGGGFLQNAAATAAGVAGGVALGNLLGGLFGGHSGGGLFGGGSGGAGFPGGNETVNIFEGPEGHDQSQLDQGQFDPGAPDDAGYIDDASFDDGSGDDGSGGGFDDV
ncbi:MAG TPA: DUF2076 domain-containing protein [Roseiarcus sp.]|jgi:hypothetical protein|nr:DUF2076 domain-containing protein [Roseiarcus sp.]